MASLIEKKENNVVVLTIDVSKEDFASAIQKSFQKNKNRFQIPGFRKGKAPYHMVKQYYGEGVLYDDAIDFAVAPSYAAAVEEHNLKLVSKPELDILDIGAEKGLTYTITVTQKPEVTLGAYLGVEAPYHFHDATQEDVQKELDRVLERNSRMIPVEGRPVAMDDTVTIDYEGFLNGVAFEGGKADGYDLKIGSNSFIPGFEEQLVGHFAEEEFPITATFPQDYHSEELKGQEVTFQIRIHSIKARELPVMDDEFAKDVSEFDTLEEYKADILAKKQEQAKDHAASDFKNAVVKVACDNAQVDIPDCMVDAEVDQLADEQATRMKYQGIEIDQYLQYVGQTMEDFRAGLVPVAKVRVKSNLVIEAIAKAERIEISDEELDAESEKMALQYNMNKDELISRLGGNNSYIRENLAAQKTVDMIAEAAIKADFHDHGQEDKDTSETNS